MIDINIKKQLEEDFERYSFEFYNVNKRFTLEDFGLFATSIINYNVQNHRISTELKIEYALHLTKLYNYGIGNIISNNHLNEIAKVIASDFTVDFNIIKDVYGK